MTPEPERFKTLWRPIETAPKGMVVLGRRHMGGAAAEIYFSAMTDQWENDEGKSGFTEWQPLLLDKTETR